MIISLENENHPTAEIKIVYLDTQRVTFQNSDGICQCDFEMVGDMPTEQELKTAIEGVLYTEQ